MRREHGIWAIGIASVVVACHRGNPPGADVDASASGLPVPAFGPASGPTVGTASADAAALGASSRDAAARVTLARDATGIGADGDAATPEAGPPRAVPVDDASPLPPSSDAAADAAVLGQTRDKPSASSEAFEARMKAVWEAIVRDDPDHAAGSFFPVEAYEQVKAIPTPARDWRYRLMGNFKRDIHALHADLGRAAEGATFVRVDVPEARARWVDPGEETNAVGYYRVYGTRIVYAVDGKERSIGVTSLISWRGEWYVVHLTGFQ